jgi:hypothetical protein
MQALFSLSTASGSIRTVPGDIPALRYAGIFADHIDRRKYATENVDARVPSWTWGVFRWRRWIAEFDNTSSADVLRFQALWNFRLLPLRNFLRVVASARGAFEATV